MEKQRQSSGFANIVCRPSWVGYWVPARSWKQVVIPCQVVLQLQLVSIWVPVKCWPCGPMRLREYCISVLQQLMITNVCTSSEWQELQYQYLVLGNCLSVNEIVTFGVVEGIGVREERGMDMVDIIETVAVETLSLIILFHLLETHLYISSMFCPVVYSV